jgi:transcriptional regulator with XRE-family HTH domain
MCNKRQMQVNLPALLKSRGLSLSGLARELDVNKATVTRWAQKAVPLTRVFQVEKQTGIPREQLRPDFFGGPQ